MKIAKLSNWESYVSWCVSGEFRFKGKNCYPDRYRAEIIEHSQGAMVCTVDIRQPCLLLYPLQEWGLLSKDCINYRFDLTQRSVQRVMLGYATECELDATGQF